MSAPLLQIKQLTVAFSGRPVVENVSLSLQAGEMLAIVGESGSGKSMTALSVLGLLPETATAQGSIDFEGQELLGAPESKLRAVRGKRIGMVFQEPLSALNPLHSIGKQIGEALKIHHGHASPARIAELLEQVGLEYMRNRLDAYPHQLSGGERQRVLIAIAIANDPAVLIADEPTTAVDVTIQKKLLELLKRLQTEHRMSILLITHDLPLVRRMADRVAVMQAGHMVEQGSVTDVFATPKHPYTQHLLGSAPKGTAAPLSASAPTVMSCESVRVTFPIRGGLLRRKIGEVVAVDGISLDIRAGETLGIVGESGSGKSTLGFALLKLMPSEGRIVFLGRDMQTMRGPALVTLRKHMQPVFQDPFGSLNPRMTVAQIVEEGLKVHEPQLTPRERLQRVREALAEVGLSPDMADRYPHAFSGGQRQRIGIARAVVLKPKFIVLDEPTSALDLSVQAQIVALLRSLQASAAIAYLFISHDFRVVQAVSHRIAVMRHGKIVEAGETAQLLSHPQQDYTKALIDAAMLNVASLRAV